MRGSVFVRTYQPSYTCALKIEAEFSMKARRVLIQWESPKMSFCIEPDSPVKIKCHDSYLKVKKYFFFVISNACQTKAEIFPLFFFSQPSCITVYFDVFAAETMILYEKSISYLRTRGLRTLAPAITSHLGLPLQRETALHGLCLEVADIRNMAYLGSTLSPLQSLLPVNVTKQQRPLPRSVARIRHCSK